MSLPRWWTGRPKKFRWSLTVSAVLVVGVGLAVVLWPSSHSAATPAGGGTRLTTRQATTMAKQLADPDPNVVAQMLASSVRQQYLQDPAALVPAGDTLTIDAASFTTGSGGADYGTVTAKAAGPQPGIFLVLLEREQGSWRVLNTAPQQ